MIDIYNKNDEPTALFDLKAARLLADGRATVYLAIFFVDVKFTVGALQAFGESVLLV